jgi:NADH-quinone oxidoreductase subunit C
MITELLEVVAVQEAIGEHYIGAREDKGFLYILVHRDGLLDAMRALKNDPELRYEFFSECLGVDYSTWTHARDFKERFEVVYNLMSLSLGRRVFIKTGVDDGQSLDSALELFAGADYPEREIGDLYGIVFKGNEIKPGARFMLPDDWIGFPLRKEYPLGGDDVLFDGGSKGPSVEHESVPHAGESFEGKTGSNDVSGR